MKYQSYSAPLCVKPWKDGADNGGATAQGVTAKTIKVAVLYRRPVSDAARRRKGLYLNQATGENSADRAGRLDQGHQRDLQVRLRDVGTHGRVHVREDDR